MSQNIAQLYIANPASSMISTDLLYLGRSPYGATMDFAITWNNMQLSIASVGTITTGAWNGTIIGATYGGTGFNNGSLTINLGSGALNDILTSDGSGNASWATPGYLTGAVLLAPTSNQVITGAYTLSLASADMSINGLTVGRGLGNISTNTVFGAAAFAANTTGASNVMIGFGAGNLITTASASVAIGANALNKNVSSSNCVAIGYEAANASTGSQVVAIGVATLAVNTSSTSTAIGYNAAFANTSGTITAVGNGAGQSNTTGLVTAVGYLALQNFTGTGSAVAIGHQALRVLTTGNANVAIGFLAGNTVTTGASNAVIGFQSFSTSGISTSFSTALGATTLQNDTGGSNVAIGYAALKLLTSGTGVVGIGYQSGLNGASGSASITTGTYCTLLGYQAGVTNAATTGAIAIGANAVAAISTGSTSGTIGSGIAIGSATYPVGVRGDGSLYPGNTSGGYWAPQINGTVYQIPLLASGTTGSVLLTSQTNTTASGIAQYLDKGTGIEASNAVTINHQSGTITTSSLTTAASGSYTITLTNSLILSSSNLILTSIGNGSNTITAINLKSYCSAANTAVIVINNNNLLSALNGTVVINFLII